MVDRNRGKVSEDTKLPRGAISCTGFRDFRVFRGSPSIVLVASLVVLLRASDAARGDWLTHRGNPQRTGAADELPGPKAPKVLWAHKTRDNYIAAPVPGGKEL